MKFIVKEEHKENKKNYDVKYAKENLQQVRLSLNKETDADLIEWINQQPNKQGYLKRLIREDMEKNK